MQIHRLAYICPRADRLLRNNDTKTFLLYRCITGVFAASSSCTVYRSCTRSDKRCVANYLMVSCVPIVAICHDFRCLFSNVEKMESRRSEVVALARFSRVGRADKIRNFPSRTANVLGALLNLNLDTSDDTQNPTWACLLATEAIAKYTRTSHS